MTQTIRPWAALWSLVLGFFMILVDTTIVSVANPSIMQGLDTSMIATLWATSAYLLAYAVPLLITGRLGDRFGPRRIYLLGLAVFTLASLACGLAQDISVLIAARVLQGLGASLMTPQTMAVITRIFRPRERGQAMAVWGVTAGVATLVGPILGGFMLDAWGWEWIFFINVPVGIIGFVLALRFVPVLPTNPHRFDWLGVVLSALGMFLLVFGLQEGPTYEWGSIWGPISVPLLIVSGVIVLVLFVVWQAVQKGEPLIPLQVFRDRNFSLGSAVITAVGFAVTGMSLPLMFYLQLVRGLTPTQSALMMVPMAVMSILLARPVGKLIDRREPRRLPLIGMTLNVLGLAIYVLASTPDSPLWVLLIPSVLIGLGSAYMWGPMTSIATFNLDNELAGAGSGVYNTSRQVGSVLGSAAMAAIMSVLLSARLGEATAANIAGGGGAEVTILPEAMRAPFAEAMALSILMPIGAYILAIIGASFFARRPPKTGPVAVLPTDSIPTGPQG